MFGVTGCRDWGVVLLVSGWLSGQLGDPQLYSVEETRLLSCVSRCRELRTPCFGAVEVPLLRGALDL